MPMVRVACLPGLIAALVAGTALADGRAEVARGDAVNGRVIFEQLCSICHAASADGSGETRGPNLFAVVGRRAGSEQNFAMYSPALQAYGAKWNISALDEFLKDPVATVPGTNMPVSMPDDMERADVIAYLASLK